jgi:hypothetical protein
MSKSLFAKTAVGVLTFGIVGAVSSVAMASTLDLVANGSAAAGKATYTTQVDSVGVTLTAAPTGAVLTWEAGDGLGIQSTAGYEYDEVEGAEVLTVSFNQPVHITQVVLTDLFKEQSNTAGNLATYWYLEEGKYQLADGSIHTFQAASSQVPGTNGILTLNVNATTTSISFSAPGYTDPTKVKTSCWSSTTVNKEDNEFSIAKISFDKLQSNGVPELDGRSAFSAAGLLVGGIFAACSRRRKLSVSTRA